MWKTGDAKNGYEIAIERENTLIKLKCWGFWDAALAAKYRADMVAAMTELKGTTWFVVGDISEYPPQAPEIAQVHAGLMGTAVEFGMARAVSVVSRALTRMQIQRMAKESGVPEFAYFQDEAEARKSLRS